MSTFFKNNRLNITNSIKENSILILFSGKETVKLGDQNHPFTPNRNFLYLTGLDKPNLIYMLKKTKDITETLFIPRLDEIKAKWDGNLLTKKQANQISGLENIKYIDEFEELLSTTIFKNNTEILYLDLENRYFIENQATSLANKIHKNYPYITIKNIYENFAKLRNKKSKEEIENIKKAIEITKTGIYAILKNAKPNQTEYEIEAYFDFELKRNGVKEKAFDTICASGKNATILHYTENNKKISENDLVLLDLGATFKYYSADISRTFPINGKFTSRQKLFYNIVLKAQELAIKNIKPNVKISQLQTIVKEFYFKKLSEIGLISTIEEVNKYYYHNIGHLLGLETHDIAYKNSDTLKENTILTIEPGLYIPEENIGIRIEDNILVTKSGAEVLSKDIIKKVEDIEAFMQGK